MNIRRILTLLICVAVFNQVTAYAGEGMQLFDAAGENFQNDEGNSLPDCCITVPEYAKLYVGEKDKAHFVSFTEHTEVLSDVADGKASYYYELENGKMYNLRVTSDDYVTYAARFEKAEDFSLEITEQQLECNGAGKKDTDYDVSANNGYNVADIFLNINPEGYLKLENPGDTYQIVALRNWEVVDDTFSNYFVEPDFSYTVIDENGEESDVVTIDKNGLLTAEHEGTAIVLVTFDALNYENAVGGPFFGAIWPENTGVFVVGIGAEESGIETGMTLNEGKNNKEFKLSGDGIDSEHDCIYFTGESGNYNFTPLTGGCSVSVAKPLIDSDMTFDGFDEILPGADGSFSVPLAHGRNIVKLEKNGKSEYQVITAKKVEVSVNGGDAVYPGDKLFVTFDTLYHPANKLAGVYNMDTLPVYEAVSGYTDVLIGGLPSQYDFSGNPDSQTVCNIIKETSLWDGMMIAYEKESDLVIPEDYNEETFTLSGGYLLCTGFGDPFGNHRGITYEGGKAENLNSAQKTGFLGILPDIEIPVTISQSPVSGIETAGELLKKQYYPGEKISTDGLEVYVLFEDGKKQKISSYSVFPETAEADTEKITVKYRDFEAELEIEVLEAVAEGIEITKMPDKLVYKSGEFFNPTGTVVSLAFKGGRKIQISDYTYEPERVLNENDSEITIKYKYEGAEFTAVVPITVKAVSGGSGGGGSTSIKVYFSLYGDSKHGNDGEVHTYKKGNLEKWLKKTSVSVDKGSTVFDVISKSLSLAGIPYTDNSGAYISGIKGLSEFDNGSASGWMYAVNGKIADVSASDYVVKNGDEVVMFYTDDFYAEDSFEEEKKPSSSGSSSSGSSSAKKKNTVASSSVPVMQTEEKTENAVKENKKIIFSDIDEKAWYAEGVSYVVEKNLFNGVSEEKFNPGGTMTRAMFTTVLYRLENEAAYKTKTAFADVNKGAYYYDAVSWASETGIINGVTETEFCPDMPVTREQIAVILHRYVNLKGFAEADKKSEKTEFSDSEKASEWAVEAVAFCRGAGLMNGRENNEFGFSDNATRAETAEIFMNICKKFLL